MAEDEKETVVEGENLQVEDQQVVVDPEARSDAEQQKFEADFALKMVDTLVNFNAQQISSYEIPTTFFTDGRTVLLWPLSQSRFLLDPVPAIYPENGFLLFKGVPSPHVYKAYSKQV